MQRQKTIRQSRTHFFKSDNDSRDHFETKREVNGTSFFCKRSKEKGWRVRVLYSIDKKTRTRTFECDRWKPKQHVDTSQFIYSPKKKKIRRSQRDVVSLKDSPSSNKTLQWVWADGFFFFCFFFYLSFASINIDVITTTTTTTRRRRRRIFFDATTTVRVSSFMALPPPMGGTFLSQNSTEWKSRKCLTNSNLFHHSHRKRKKRLYSTLTMGESWRYYWSCKIFNTKIWVQ